MLARARVRSQRKGKLRHRFHADVVVESLSSWPKAASGVTVQLGRSNKLYETERAEPVDGKLAWEESLSIDYTLFGLEGAFDAKARGWRAAASAHSGLSLLVLGLWRRQSAHA